MLAPDIHLCMHPGFAEAKGKLDIVLDNMVRWNSKLIPGYGCQDAKKDLSSSFNEWNKRSKMKWILDLSYLNKFQFLQINKKG